MPSALASLHDASQHRPRPLPLLLHMLRSEAGADEARIAAVLRGIRAYQQAPRSAGRPSPPAVRQIGRVRLLDYGGAGRPIVFVPSLINSADILDLDAERSLVRWLADQGARSMLVDWGQPSSAEAGCSLGDHVTRYLLPLLDDLKPAPVLVGYCLGGTLAIAAAALAPAHALCTIAAPWRFRDYAGDTRDLMAGLWAEARSAAKSVGLLPMEVLQAAFWQIDVERTLGKFDDFAQVADDPAAVRKFVAVEDWANGGPPLAYAAAEELFKTLIRDDATGRGAWRVGGRVVRPEALDLPALEIVSSTDRIVPAAAAAGVGRRITTGLGHVGMIVGSKAPETIWRPLAEWIAQLG